MPRLRRAEYRSDTSYATLGTTGTLETAAEDVSFAERFNSFSRDTCCKIAITTHHEPDVPRRHGVRPFVSTQKRRRLLQLVVFGVSLPQHRKIGIGIFPRAEEILIGSFCLRCISFERVGAPEAEM
jgi:hypothetical protein